MAAVGGAGARGARLADLCTEDKAKVARLMQDLVKLREEKGGQKARLERLRTQNESIVKEVASLKVKFGQSMQLLRKYQVRKSRFFSFLLETHSVFGILRSITTAYLWLLWKSDRFFFRRFVEGECDDTRMRPVLLRFSCVAVSHTRSTKLLRAQRL